MLKRWFKPIRSKKEQQLIIDMRSGYSIETHMHTSEGSLCAGASGREMARFYKHLGYSGIIVSDHFFNGNTTIPPHFPWHERVRLFCRGYENAAAEGKRIGLDVFFAWEYGYHGTEFLTVGLDKEWLLKNSDVLDWGVEEYLDRVRTDGAFVIHAHPFREAPYIRKLRLFPDHVDAVEVINSRNSSCEQDVKAYRYALKHGLAFTSGSDSHDAQVLPGGGMIFDRRPESSADLIAMLRVGEYTRLIGMERIESPK
ncbi:MAG: PHP-associated domain-containing protein [Oscillospiraceae bacterium]|jgi:hypothetical protein|nr:PHP-associated domain-containing protein [Oscillospiraceae bacterium]